MMSTVGERLKEERKRLKLPQTACAEAGNVSLKTQGNYENNVSSPTLAYMDAIHQLGIDSYYVMSGERITTTELHPIDSQKLKAILGQIENWSIQQNTDLPIDVKTELVTHFYEHFTSESDVEVKSIHKLLRLFSLT